MARVEVEVAARRAATEAARPRWHLLMELMVGNRNSANNNEWNMNVNAIEESAFDGDQFQFTQFVEMMMFPEGSMVMRRAPFEERVATRSSLNSQGRLYEFQHSLLLTQIALARSRFSICG